MSTLGRFRWPVILPFIVILVACSGDGPMPTATETQNPAATPRGDIRVHPNAGSLGNAHGDSCSYTGSIADADNCADTRSDTYVHAGTSPYAHTNTVCRTN